MRKKISQLSTFSVKIIWAFMNLHVLTFNKAFRRIKQNMISVEEFKKGSITSNEIENVANV